MPVEINESKDFDKFADEMRKLIKNVPKIVGITAVGLFKANFRKQGFDTGSGITMWKSRDPET